ncbi:MAG: MFS transporter [Rhodobacteraceae bacterium]|nr:MFS transporter [Paracoccaceae bacterium]MCW9043300.1 MFS transporter [Pseudopelagicola sp.]
MIRPRFLLDNAPFLAVGALLTLLSSFGQTFFISIFAGEIRATFGLSHGQWGGLYMLGTSASAVVMIWAGSLTDHFRVRTLGPVILLGLACACVAMAVNPYAALLPVVIFALRFFGQGMTSHIAVVAMARWFVARRGRALAIAALGFSLGEALLPLIFVSLMTVIDWHLLWLVGAGACLLGGPLLFWLLGKERTPQSLAQSQSNTGMNARHWHRAEALRHPLFWVMVPAILGLSAFNTAFFFHQVHFASLKGWSHVEFVAFFPLYTGTGIAAMIVAGWALDRLGTARLIPFYQLPLAAGFLTLALATTPLGLGLGILFLGLTTGANATLPNAFWAEFYGTAHIGAIKALATAVMVLGSAIGPGLTGLLIDLGIGLEDQFLGVAVFFVATSALMGWGVRRAAASLR